MNCVSLQWIHANFIIANSCPKAKCLVFFLTGKGAPWEMLYRRCGGYWSSSWVQYMQLLTKTLENCQWKSQHWIPPKVHQVFSQSKVPPYRLLRLLLHLLLLCHTPWRTSHDFTWKWNWLTMLFPSCRENNLHLSLYINVPCTYTTGADMCWGFDILSLKAK